MTFLVGGLAALGVPALAPAQPDAASAPLVPYHRMLGRYESEALAEALAARGLVVDEAPEGKRVGRIHVYNLDVFGAQDGWLRVFNHLHVTTREGIIRREILPRSGEPWDEDLAQQTRRRLNASAMTTLSLVVPVRSGQPGVVDILAVTRDLWSLRLNSNFEYQAGVLSLLHFELAENNLLGLRKQLSVAYDLDLGRYAVGPSYFDTNLRGTRWQLDADARVLFGRASDRAEGSTSNLTLRYPFWSFAQPWSFVASAGHALATVRRFAGVMAADVTPALCVFAGDPNRCDPDPSAGVPVHYRLRSQRASAQLIRQFGARLVHRVRAGHTFFVTRRDLFEEDFAARPDLRQPFIERVLPRSERVSAPFLGYSLQSPVFVTFRDLASFDFPEDLAMGPRLDLSVLWALPELGSERRFWNLAAGVGWRAEVGERGLVDLGVGASTRVQDGEAIDRSASASLYAATPRLFRALRLVGRVAAQGLDRNRVNTRLALGGDSGLRGYPIGVFQGEALVIGNLEARSRPLAVGFARLGLVLFWDAGHVAAELASLSLHHDLGVGLRAVIPQAQSTAIRFDWAVATHDVRLGDGRVLPTAGLPGRFSAGFAQAF